MLVRRTVKRLTCSVRGNILRMRSMKIGNGSVVDAGSLGGAPERVAIGFGCYINRRCYFDVTGQITGAEIDNSLGNAPDRLTYSGYGNSNPIDTNDTLQGRARNRRVELTRQ